MYRTLFSNSALHGPHVGVSREIRLRLLLLTWFVLYWGLFVLVIALTADDLAVAAACDADPGTARCFLGPKGWGAGRPGQSAETAIT